MIAEVGAPAAGRPPAGPNTASSNFDHRAAPRNCRGRRPAGGARILRVFLRELGELRGIGLRLRGDVVGELFSAAASPPASRPFFTGIRMCAADRSSRRVLLRVGVVLLLHLVRLDLHLRGQRIRVRIAYSMRACSGVWNAVWFCRRTPSPGVSSTFVPSGTARCRWSRPRCRAAARGRPRNLTVDGATMLAPPPAPAPRRS